MGNPSADECQPFACAIQGCLQRNNYNQDACRSVIEALLDCCEVNRAKDLPSCDGFKFQVQKRLKEKKEASSK